MSSREFVIQIRLWVIKKNPKHARIKTHAWTQIPTIRRCLARILSRSATYAFRPGVSWAVHDCCWIFRGFKVRKKLSEFWGKLQQGFPHIPFLIISRIPEMVLRSLRSIRMLSVSAEMQLPSDLYIILGTKCSRAISFPKDIVPAANFGDENLLHIYSPGAGFSAAIRCARFHNGSI
jgi:hypothetical protein